MIGPFSSFFTFPATYINIDFADYPNAQRKPLKKVKDSSGQDMEFAFSLQLKLNPEKLGMLYDKHKLDYEKVFLQWIDQEIFVIVGTFQNDAFWKNRAQSALVLKEGINNKFKENHEFATCENFQIINVQLSAVRENSLINTQVQNQIGKTKKKEQKAK